MEQNCAGFPWECTFIWLLWCTCSQQKFVFELLNNVFSDFTDTNSITISQLVIWPKLIIYFHSSWCHILSIVVQAGMEWTWKQILAGTGGMEWKYVYTLGHNLSCLSEDISAPVNMTTDLSTLQSTILPSCNVFVDVTVEMSLCRIQCASWVAEVTGWRNVHTGLPARISHLSRHHLYLRQLPRKCHVIVICYWQSTREERLIFVCWIDNVHCVSKKVPTFALSVTLSNLNRFHTFCIAGKRMKFATKPIQQSPPHLRHSRYTTSGN